MTEARERLVQGILPDPDPLGERPLYYNNEGQPVFPRDEETVYDKDRDRALEKFDHRIETAVSKRVLNRRRQQVIATDRQMQSLMGKWWGQAGRTRR